MVVRACAALATAVLVAVLAAPAAAQAAVFGADFEADYSAIDLGAPDAVPAQLAGLTFKRGDDDTLLIAGGSDTAAGAIYEVPLERGADGRIAGFAGPGTVFASAPYIDGGLAYEPSSGVLFFTGYNANTIGQIKPGSTEPDRVINLTDLGVDGSVGSLTFVPAGVPGAGTLKVASYNSGDIYDIPFSPDGQGTFELGDAVLQTTLEGGPEGLVYVPEGSPGFDAPSMIVAEYSNNELGAYEVDAAGSPEPASRRTFLQAPLPEGAFLSDGAGELIFTSASTVLVVHGFAGGATVTPVGDSNDVRVVAIAVSEFLFPDGGAAGVVLARHDVFADALAGAPLGGEVRPVLYTSGGPDEVLDPPTRAEIDRLLGEGPRDGAFADVTILGGAQAVSAAVEQELEAAGYSVERLNGPTRFETAAAIAERVLAANPGQSTAMLATGSNFPDAVTGGAYGANFGIPILLTPPDALHPTAQAVLAEGGIDRTIVLGGAGVVSGAAASQAPGAERVAGSNRMATAARVAFDLWGVEATNAVVVNLERPDSWAVALSAAILSASVDGAQLGTGVNEVPTETRAYLENVDPTTVYVIGGSDFVADAVVSELRST